jgi:phosphatidylinositol-3-phosphatase
LPATPNDPVQQFKRVPICVINPKARCIGRDHFGINRRDIVTHPQIFRLSVLLAIIAGTALFASKLITTAAAHGAPRPRHVFIIVLENEGYNKTFGAESRALYLRKRLPQMGALLENYYAIGHNSLDNYIAMISGQAPNPLTQADCWNYIPFVQTGVAAYGQAIGQGCIYQQNILTIANQLESKGLTWKGYMEDMGNNPFRESAACGQPIRYFPDSTQKAEKGDQYAARHNPFVYFYSIVDDWSDCAAHVVNFSALATDLRRVRTTPNFAYIVPNLCHDGHDGGTAKKRCVDGQPGGLISADKFLKDNVPRILASPAFRRDGLLIVTFDEADLDEADADNFRACCHERRGPNINPGATVVYYDPPGQDPDKGPGISSSGGGRIGAILVSPFIRPGTLSNVPYNHYSLLRSIEDFFGVGHLGYAAQKGLKPFGNEIFNQPKG